MSTIQHPWISWELRPLVQLFGGAPCPQDLGSEYPHTSPECNLRAGGTVEPSQFRACVQGGTFIPFIILKHYMYLSAMANTRCWYTKWHLINYTKNLTSLANSISYHSFGSPKKRHLPTRCNISAVLGFTSSVICHWCNWDYMHTTSILGTSRKGEHTHIHLDFGCAYKYWIHFL